MPRSGRTRAEHALFDSLVCRFRRTDDRAADPAGPEGEPLGGDPGSGGLASEEAGMRGQALEQGVVCVPRKNEERRGAF